MTVALIVVCSFGVGTVVGFRLAVWGIVGGIKEGRWTKSEVDKLAAMWNTRPRTAAKQ